MADEISVDTDAMMKGAASLGNLAGQVQTIFGNLSSALAAAGRAWGDDENGQTFQSGYEETHESLLDGMSETSQALDSTQQGVVTMAQGFAETEAQNLAAVNAGSDDADSGSGSGHGGSGDDGHDAKD